ncbi:hypothetical protein BH10BDE1_BH10BDE1_13880 [soil metagenome]
MKNRWIWIGAIVAVILIAIAILKFSSGSKDVLNADGVRDDVAVAIQQTFPESEMVRAAATQVARTIQLSIDDPENALEIRRRGEAATACWYAVRGEVSENENTSLVLKVEAMVVNSYRRTRAYIRYNSKLSGQIFESIQPDFSSCEFDVASMEQ